MLNEFTFLIYRKLEIAKTSMWTSNSTGKIPKTTIFFLKSHKCASSTVQNILMRFGVTHNLDFVLPEVANYVGNPEPFSPKFIGFDLRTVDNKYDIFTHHTRFNYDQVLSVMRDNATFVTIIRNPADLYESLFSFYNFDEVFNVSLQKLLNDTNEMAKIDRRYYGKIGFNQMSWDMGLHEKYFNSRRDVEKFVQKINREFDFVMVAEFMEASLVLLCELMRWPLENVIFLNLNSRTEGSKLKLNLDERQRLLELNGADEIVYNFFLKKFRERVLTYGYNKIMQDVAKLLVLNNQLWFRCIEGTKHVSNVTVYKLRDQKDWLCIHATMSELTFTQEIRRHQKSKMKIMNRLDSFLHEST